MNNESKAKVFYYNDEKDFEELWGMLDKLEDIEDNPPILIVANGLPKNVNSENDNDEPENENLKSENDNDQLVFNAYISLELWITLFCRAFLKEKETDKIPKIAVLDSPNNLNIERIKEYIPNFPFYSLCEIEDFMENLSQASKLKVDRQRLDESIIKWKTQLFETTSGNGNSHDASNQIGGMIMRAGLAPAQRTDLPDKLHQKAATLCIQHLFADQNSHKEYTGLKETQIVLVDDCCNEGYDKLIRKILNSEAKIKSQKGVFNNKHPDSEVEKDSINKVLGMTFNGDKHQLFSGGDLLFLDLRLWKKENEENVLEKYKQVADKVDPENFFGLCGVNKDQNEFNKKVKKFMTSNSHKRLALMPLIINELDPSLAIILFSSTQHRSVYQAVRDCPAIITNFSKPYIGGYDRDEYEPETVLNGLYTALYKARPMIEVRKVWKYAVEQWDDIPIINETNNMKDKKDNNLKLTWSNRWPSEDNILTENWPWKWLRKTWLPLAQKGEYAFAAAESWCYLVKLLGKTRIEILEKETKVKTIGTCIKIIKDAQYVPMMFLDKENNKDKDTDEDDIIRKIAIVSALALIELIREWTKKPQGDNNDE